ncbi:hypothetical protein ACTFIY_010225 [Dictyostelium cf. discoideum]
MKKVLFIFSSLFICLCFSQKFNVPYKVYDFLPSQPGFNINYTQYSNDKSIQSTGLVKKLLNPKTHKPEYCCANEKFNFISNRKEYDQSFTETPGISKTVINTFTFNSVQYSDGKVKYAVTLKPFTPINGKGWNNGVSGENRYWCIEGHYKFNYQVNKKTSDFFSIYEGGDISAFIDGKLAFEFAGTSNPNSAVNHKSLNLEVGKTYPFDFFMCQRFDKNKPFGYLQFDTPFVFQCNNIPGVNDDVCPPPTPKPTTPPTTPKPTTPKPTTTPPTTTPKPTTPPPQCVPGKDCNDNNLCTIDACQSPSVKIPPGSNVKSYCTHTPVKCNNSNKCKPNSCNVKNGKCEPLPEVKCPPKKAVYLLGIDVGCQPEICEPSSGNCIPDSSKGLLDKLLC